MAAKLRLTWTVCRDIRASSGVNSAGSAFAGAVMEQDKDLISEERARLTEIQDSLIDRYVEQREALEEGNRCRAIEIQFEIKELLYEKKKFSSGR